MATEYKCDNYTGQYVTKPKANMPKGEIAGRMRTLIDRETLGTQLVLGDTFLCGYIPANSVIVNAKMHINKSLGATGKLSLGTKATTEESDGSAVAADPDGLIAECDAGGQAALSKAPAAAAMLYKRLGSETQIYATVTEVSDGTVLDGVLTIEVDYVND